MIFYLVLTHPSNQFDLHPFALQVGKGEINLLNRTEEDGVREADTIYFFKSFE